MSDVNDDFARAKHPGYSGGYGPTTDWKDPKGPWMWVRYSEREPDGMCKRFFGYADSEDEAERLAGMARDGSGQLI